MMENFRNMDEKELMESDVPWPKTRKELNEIIDQLTERDHDYGTCVYAMSIIAMASFYYVSSKLGVTGFQASCADMDFMKRSRRLKNGFRILDYQKLLYPQHLNKEDFPTHEELLEENKDHLSKIAKQKLKDSPNAHPKVLKRWKYVASLVK